LPPEREIRGLLGGTPCLTVTSMSPTLLGGPDVFLACLIRRLCRCAGLPGALVGEFVRRVLPCWNCLIISEPPAHQ
jgi:hypothetical protein